MTAERDRGARRSVLITGSSGLVGRILTAAWEDQYELTLVDLRPPPRRTRLPFAAGDVSSLRFVRPLCTGVDTVVHLAGLASPLADWSELRRHNIKSTWAVLNAARDAGCRRLVFASSVMIELDPALPYSRAKVIGERLGQRYAEAGPLSVICLRPGHVLTAGHRQLWPGAPYLSYVVMDDDLIAAFTLAVGAPPAMRFETFTIISANRHPRVDIADARARLGYAPRMDAFALADRQFRTPRGLLKRAKSWLRSRL